MTVADKTHFDPLQSVAMAAISYTYVAPEAQASGQVAPQQWYSKIHFPHVSNEVAPNAEVHALLAAFVVVFEQRLLLNLFLIIFLSF